VWNRRGILCRSCGVCEAFNIVFLCVKMVNMSVYCFASCMCECVLFLLSLFVSGVRACGVCI
jgi:hypothetical protein